MRYNLDGLVLLPLFDMSDLRFYFDKELSMYLNQLKKQRRHPGGATFLYSIWDVGAQRPTPNKPPPSEATGSTKRPPHF